MTTCPNCNKSYVDGTPNCTVCGVDLEETQEKQKGRPTIPKVGWVLCGVIIMVAVIAISVMCFMFPTISKEKYLVYLKDGELYLDMFNSQGAFAITEDLPGKYDDAMAYAYKDVALAELTTLSNDGTLIFYPNHMTIGCKFDLYYRSTNRIAEEGIKIADKVSSYQVAPNGESLIYSNEKGLFWTDFSKKEKLTEHCWNYWISEDCTIAYWTQGSGISRWEKGKGSKYISDLSEVLLITEDFSKVYFDGGDGSIYVSANGQPGECVFENAKCLQVYDDGTMYFIMEEEDRIPMSDYVIDDYLETDKDTSSMTAEQLKEKEKRDAMRQEIAENARYIHRNALYYFNGREPVKVADNVVSKGYLFPYDEYTYVASESDALAAICVDIEMYKGQEKILLSEIDNVTDTYLEWVGTYEFERETMVLLEEKSQRFDKTFESKRMFSKDGSKLYMLNEDEKTLYEIDLTKEKWELKECATNVHIEPEAIVMLEDGIMYYKDVEFYEGAWYMYGTLCVNQEEVATDVLYDKYAIDAQENIYFFLDYNGSTGKLCCYKDGALMEIDQNVYTLDFKACESNGIFYMKEYDRKILKGNLCYSENGEAGKIVVKDVAGIVKP